MTLLEFFGALSAFAKAVPVIDRWLQDLILEYRNYRIAQDAVAAKAGIATAEATNSTKNINDLIGKDMR